MAEVCCLVDLVLFWRGHGIGEFQQQNIGIIEKNYIELHNASHVWFCFWHVLGEFWAVNVKPKQPSEDWGPHGNEGKCLPNARGDDPLPTLPTASWLKAGSSVSRKELPLTL